VKLALAEIVKDLLPLLIGALLIGFRGRADIGIAFAGYCLMLGRLWPVFNRFRGCHGCIALILCGLLIEPSVGVTAAAGVIAGIWIFKTLSMGAVAGALAMAAVAVMVVEKQLILILTALICLLVLLHHIPAMRRMLRGTEEKLSRKEDISYKFDEKF
jgi:glycerol-3-phosphate acyltransferase PlsY